MVAEIRGATLADLPLIVELLMQDARSRQAHDPKLWALADDGRAKVEAAVSFALTAERQPFRQQWLVAEADDRLVGIIYSAVNILTDVVHGLLDPRLMERA